MHMTTNEKTAEQIESKGNEVTGSNSNTAKRAAKIKNDYLLLKNYNENILPMRGILLKTAINSISQIEEGKFSIGNFSGTKKIKAKSMFQIEIISGIMMYIEDLIVLSESFRRRTSYYELLDLSDENQNDVGKTIERFFENVNSFSDEEFRRIFGYKDPSQLNLEEDESKLAEKVIQNNIAEMRRLFVQIGKFGKTHHPVFRRFKHAGAPLMLGMKKKQQDTPLSGFDSYTHVLIGKDPFREIIIIPLSKDVLNGYHIIIHAIQTCLRDLVTNQIACIERNITGILPNERYFQGSFSEKENKLYNKILVEFYNKHPFHTDDLKHFLLESKAKKENILWYLDLSDFLKECKKRGEATGG